jgi:hypothetical protein
MSGWTKAAAGAIGATVVGAAHRVVAEEVYEDTQKVAAFDERLAATTSAAADAAVPA